MMLQQSLKRKPITVFNRITVTLKFKFKRLFSKLKLKVCTRSYKLEVNCKKTRLDDPLLVINARERVIAIAYISKPAGLQGK